MSLNTIIKRLDGTTYDLGQLGIKTQDIDISSPTPRHFTDTVDARHGVIDMGTVYDARSINASFYAEAADGDDYGLMRDEIFRLFRSKESFYLIESRNPGKRWRVKVADSYSLEQRRVFGFFEIEFISYSGLAESVGTTLDPFTFDAEVWQVGQGLSEEELLYNHSATSFPIFNAGDEMINPRYMPLVIKYVGASSKLSITNTTTGDSWSYTGDSNSGDSIELNGVRAVKNGLSIYRDTNRKLLTIAPGWNDFTISGTSGSFEISFDFRYYYL